jgi:hypothetical protein
MAENHSSSDNASKENVAFKLLQVIINSEFGNSYPPDRKWVLKAYSECLQTVWSGKPPAQ